MFWKKTTSHICSTFPDFFQNLKLRVVCKNVVPTLPAEHFEVFRPMFEFIKQKCLEDLPKRQHVDKKLAESV